MVKVPATVPTFSDEDIADILEKFEEILRGRSFLSMGKHGKLFEERFAEYIGTKRAVACSSGTSALELIFRAIGIDGCEVIMPSNTFIATANAIINAGGTPVFADCDDDMCLSYDDAIARVTANTVAICHVHIGGLVTRDALRLADFCRERGLHFVEDACQAHGAKIDDCMAGSLGVAGAFSFFSTKVMTTGEGGMVTTDDPELADRMLSIREFGKVKTGIYTNYHEFMGYNWRMPEVAALLGLRQLDAIEDFIKARRHIAAIYDAKLAGISGIRVIRPDEPENYNCFKYILDLGPGIREYVHKAFQACDISPSGYVYELPLHKMPVFPGDNDLSLPNSERLCAQHFCLPIFPTMCEEQVTYVINCLAETIAESAK